MADEVFVAIDSGGTRTKCEICTDPGGPARSFESSVSLSGYLETRRIPEILKQIIAPLETFYRQEGLTGRPVALFISAAGYAELTREDYLDAIEEVLTGAFQGNVAVAGAANDAVTALLGSDADGVVIAGTGSNVIVRNSPRDMHQSGGHDWVAADQGSAFWIGLEAIRQVAVDFEAMDETALLNRFCETYQIELTATLDARSSRRIVAMFRSLSVGDSRMKADIARFAHSVCQAAENGDLSAQNIVKKQCEDLADLTARGIRRSFDRQRILGGLTIIESGGVMANNFYRTAFESHTKMRLSGGETEELVINWQFALNGMSGVTRAVQRIRDDSDDWLSLPRMFRPVIESFQ